MANEILAAGIMKAVEVTAKTLLHSRIKADAPGADLKTSIADGITEFAGDSLLSKLFGQNHKLQKKLDYAIEAAFKDTDAAYDFRFSDFQQYFRENNLIFKMLTKDDLRDQIQTWLSSEKKSVSSVDAHEVKQFVDALYQKLGRRIDEDDGLKMYLSPQRTEEAVKALLKEMSELKKQESVPAAQQIAPDFIRMAEDYLEKQLAALQAAKSGSKIITEGSDNIVANNEQTGADNLIQTHGNNNIIIGNKQSN